MAIMAPRLEKSAEKLTRLRLDELAVLVEVAAAGTLAGAARRLRVPKSTVGRAITRIEQELGVALVRRQARAPGLTDQGSVLANLAAPHVAALRDLATTATHDTAEAYGTLRVTAPPDFGVLLLAPLVPAFTQRYPRVRVDVELTMRVVDLVREGFDLALRVARKLPPSTLIAKKLAAVELRLYAGARYAALHPLPRRVEDLADHEHVLFTGSDGQQPMTIEGPRGSKRVVLRGRVSCNDFFCMREVVASGAGSDALPGFVARSELASGRLVRVLPDHRVEQGMNVFAVHPPQIARSPKLELFRSYLHEHAPNLLDQP
jgi:DNA-binding transcriptional LysR family regulator